MNIKGIHDYYTAIGAVDSARRTNSVAHSAEAASPASAPQDEIKISSQGSFRAQLAASVKEVAADFNAPASPDRIQTLREAYRDDACPVPAAQIADSILLGVLGVRL